MKTLFHVTHWKAGSQWIRKILEDTFPDLCVEPKVGIGHFLNDKLIHGRVYPTVYVTKEQFESIPKPFDWTKFIVIRDLRDTLISGYFSLKYSHAAISSGIVTYRDKLTSMSIEDGLIYLIHDWLQLSANVQKSWIYSDEAYIRYEDLLVDDVKQLSRVLVDTCCVDVDLKLLESSIVKNRFENLTGGRKRGQEEVLSHERKGVSGDWENYFTPKVKECFKQKYGTLLIDTKYETGLEW